MKKILIHSENIKKKGAKLQFQIKLPSTAKEVTGLLITATRRTELKREQPNLSKDFCGWIRLRTPDKRDVFYAELVSYSNHIEQQLGQLPQLGLGLADTDGWWFNGTKREFFKIRVPVENTIIEGYYEDHSKQDNELYTLKVYLEVCQ